MARKKIAVIGYGYVGKAVANYFRDHFDVLIYDTNPDQISNTQEDCNKCDLAVICVPTPEAPDYSVDLSYVESSVSWLETPLILLKSTVPPGTVDSLVEKFNKKVCFSPEFIGEGKYVVQWWKDKNYPHPTDMKYHDFHIVGGRKEDARAILEFFKTVSGPECKYQVTDAKTAELVKYAENTWGATKVTFCNEMALIANSIGVDWDEVRELWLLDGRVERMHTAVFKDKRGFSGKCFPKDLAGIIKQAEKSGFNPKFLKSVWNRNLEFVLEHGKEKHGNPDWAFPENKFL